MTRRRGSGHLWDQPGVPHKGWTCDLVIDHEEADHTCEMCGKEEIRYVHVMAHPEHRSLEVGCVCAVKMATGYKADVYQREMMARMTARQRLVASPQWRRTWKGNTRIRRHGSVHVVFRQDGGWKFVSRNAAGWGGQKYFSPRFVTKDEAIDALARHLYPLRLRPGHDRLVAAQPEEGE